MVGQAERRRIFSLVVLAIFVFLLVFQGASATDEGQNENKKITPEEIIRAIEKSSYKPALKRFLINNTRKGRILGRGSQFELSLDFSYPFFGFNLPKRIARRLQRKMYERMLKHQQEQKLKIK